METLKPYPKTMSKSRPNKPKPKSDRPGNPSPSEERRPSQSGRGQRSARPRTWRAVNAVANALSDEIEKLQGHRDAIRDLDCKEERDSKSDDDGPDDTGKPPNSGPPGGGGGGPHPPNDPNEPPRDGGGGNNPPGPPAPPNPPNVPVPPVQGSLVVSTSQANRAWMTYDPINMVSTVVPFKLSFREVVRAHYASQDYTPKSHMSARTNVLRWQHIGKYELRVDEMIAIVDEEYLLRAHKFPWWKQISVMIKTAFEEAMWSKKFWFGVVACSIGVGAVLWRKRHKIAITTTTVSLAMWKLLDWKDKSVRIKSRTHLRDYCTGTNDLNMPNIDQGADVKHIDISSQKCELKMVPIGFSFGHDYIWVPRTCCHNELNALVTRQLQPRIPVTQKGKEALRVGRRLVSKHLGRVTITLPKGLWLPTFLSKYPMARREQIVKAMNDCIVTPKVEGFPKIEIMTGKPCGKRKVRFISGFTDGYLGETGPEYYLWQKEMIKSLWSTKAQKTSSKYVYTGAFTADEIGNWFQHYKDLGWVIMLADASKFDSRNKEEVLSELYLFYNNRLSKELYCWLFDSFDKKGKTKFGYVFNVIATVASGRIDTSMGNTLIMFMLLTAIMFILDPKYVEIAQHSALGDDNNTALPYFHHTMDDVMSASLELGHEFEGQIVDSHNYHKLEYCSQWVWQVDHGVSVVGPKIGRLLAKTFVCHKHVPVEYMPAHIKAVLVGFKHYRWLPVFRTVYWRYMEVHKCDARAHYSLNDEYRIQLKEEINVDESVVYQHFFDIYGFDPVELEREIVKLPFAMGDCYEHPLISQMLEIDGVSYEYGQEDYHAWLHNNCEGVIRGLSNWLGF